MPFREKYWIPFFLLLVLICSTPKVNYGQYLIYSEAPVDISASFVRHSLEASAQEVVFNVLKVKNNASRTENFTLNITVPQGWNIIGSDKVDITVNPLDSIIIPIRVAVGAGVKGDIGYSIIASLADSRGNTIKNEYCFVKIPRETDLRIRVLDRVSYLDPLTGLSDFSILVSNKGNRDEPVTIILDGNKKIAIGNDKQTIVSYDYIISPFSDSVFVYPVALEQTKERGRNMFGVKVIASTIDTTIYNTIWFRKLESKHKNNILQSDKPLSAEIIGQGLLDATKSPTISLLVEGRTLFNKESDVYYYYRNYRSKVISDFYENTRMKVGGHIGGINVELGDRYKSVETFTTGRGGAIGYETSRFKSEVFANRYSQTSTNNYGGLFTYNTQSNTSFNTGFFYTDSRINELESKFAFASTSFKLFDKHNFFALFGYNKLNREVDGESNHDEFGAEVNYSSSVGSLRTNFRAKYGSPLYYSMFAGRLDVTMNSWWTINPRHKLSFFLKEQTNTRPIIQSNITQRTTIMGNREGKVEHHFLLPGGVQLFYGPAVQNYQWSGLLSFNDRSFNSINYKMIIGARIKNPSGSFTVSPKVEIAYSEIIENPYWEGEKNNKLSYQYFSLGYRDNNFNVLTFFTSGPRSAIDQINFASNARSARKFQFIPAYDNFVYKDIIRFYGGVSYTNDIVAKTSYSNITGQVFWYLPQNWRMYVLGVYSIQNRSNPQGIVEKFQNIYVEASIRKEFDIQHPRVKFYDADLVFFKDFNGNFIQETNEPGIKNVLAVIQLLGTDVEGRIPGDFYSAELMSDNLGHISLEKIPEGRYSLTYNAVGEDAGTFSKAVEELEIKIDRSGNYFFPFVEKNKVFGKIILNRSKLSGLGRVDVSNIRITATDSKGRSYTSLTDNNGEFVLFAPVTDEYILTINNIFYENFDLRQNNFRVQFNGYKQFEVNYVFDEKVRRINFASTPEGEGVTGIQQVRRTNISGSVKDANSQKPIRARVNLVNTRTNSIVTSTYSSATSGEYTMSFMAGDNYLLEVLADDYWYLSENLVLNQVTTFMNISRDVMLKPISVGSKVELNIQFEANSEFLAPQSVAELNRLLRLVKDNPTVKLEVQGHCDDIEALQKPEIALERAKAVSKYLIENGYSNLEIKSLGNTVPIASNDTEEGRSRNRRVEVEVISK